MKTKNVQKNIVCWQNSICEKKSSVRNNLYLSDHVKYEQFDFILSTCRKLQGNPQTSKQRINLNVVLVSDEKKNHRSGSRGQGKYSYVCKIINDIRRFGKY